MRSDEESAISLAEKSQHESPLPVAALAESRSSWPLRSPLVLGFSVALLTAIGCLGIYPEINYLWTSWTTDPLRSIGILIPPISIFLTLRVWRQMGWELRGTWWGLLVIGLAFFISRLRQQMLLLALAGNAAVSFIPVSLPVYVYGSGIVLLFAGARVWRKAWFPLALLMLCQPVPILSAGLIDIPLQHISAKVARAFATLIGFAPTTPELRLMFSPDFGMFIAPGCDGIRGAVTMGYVALLLGYIKRVSFPRWVAYVSGAVLLGYLFNLIRLCVLVIYYRIAIGHPAMENVAAQADYVIGSCLFLVAIFLFLWLGRRNQSSPEPPKKQSANTSARPRTRLLSFRCAAFALAILAAILLPPSPLSVRAEKQLDTASLAARMPRQIGDFSLARTWYEQQSGTPVIEAGAYSAPGFDEIVLAVWVAPMVHAHDPNQCWLARGLQPDSLNAQRYVTARGESISLNTGIYSDGVTDSVVVNTYCTPQSCSQIQNVTANGNLGLLFLAPVTSENAMGAQHPVSIMIRIDRLKSNAPKSVASELLLSEARKFITAIDFTSLSRAFQQ